MYLSRRTLVTKVVGLVLALGAGLPLGKEAAPFTVQHCAPMSLVHFYFSQLTLNCVFVVDRGRFVGMINKADMMKGDF